MSTLAWELTGLLTATVVGILAGLALVMWFPPEDYDA